MEIPLQLRKQFNEYERAGFHVVSVEPRGGSHYKVMFQGILEPQFLTKNANEPRAIKNNIARFRRLTKEVK